MNLVRVRNSLLGGSFAALALATCHNPGLPEPRSEVGWENEMRGDEPPQISVDANGDGVAEESSLGDVELVAYARNVCAYAGGRTVWIYGKRYCYFGGGGSSW